jgi:hypothetical protein
LVGLAGSRQQKRQFRVRAGYRKRLSGEIADRQLTQPFTPLCRPVSHSNYEDKILVVRDGLPKYKGFTGSELVDDDGRLIPEEKAEQVANLANNIEKVKVADDEGRL